MGAENRHGQSSYRKSCPISIYDVAAVETWLEDLARKGENPVCFTGSRVDLLLDEPWECRFRLQPLQRWKEALDPERVEAYRSMGWRLVGQLGPFWVWRCDDPNAPELDTDPVVQSMGYGYLERKCGAICCGCPRSCWCAWGFVSFPGSGAPGTCLWWISWSMPCRARDCSGC